MSTITTTPAPPARVDQADRVDVTPAAPRRPRSVRAALVLVGAALTLVVAAPVLLSSQDLYAWGQTGLGLDRYWSLLAPVSLDAAAVACIAMTVVSAFRRERPGIFSLLVWVFAGTSAAVQYHHGLAPAVRAVAPDGWIAFPAFSLLGPVLLHAVLSRVRKWNRQDAAEILTGAAGFGSRWLVAPWSTLAAWVASRREGIGSAAAALAFTREVKALRALAPVDQVRLAHDALGHREPYATRTWLSSRGVMVTAAAVDEATATRSPHPPAVVPAAVPGESFGTDYHRRRLADLSGQRGGLRGACRYALTVLGQDASAGDVVRWLATHGVIVQRSEANAVKRELTPADPPADPAPPVPGSALAPFVPATPIPALANGSSKS